MIKCLKCGKYLKVITKQHLLSCSNITINDYKKEFPNAPMVCDEIKKIRSQNCVNLTGKIKIVKCSICGKDMETASVNHWKFECKDCRKPKIYEDKIYIEEKDLVVCQVCFKGFEQISIKHLKLHNLTMEDYKKTFPNAILTNNRIKKQRMERAVGEKNPAKRKEVRHKISESQKFKALDWRNKYPFLFSIEEIRDGEKGIEVKCKLCNGWFTPTPTQIGERIRVFYKNQGYAENFWYCSKECKDRCPIYRTHPEQFLSSLSSKKYYTEQEYKEFRVEVLNRQKLVYGYNFCEICEKANIKDLIVHHEKPQKTHPTMILDPDNGVILCKKCHYEIAHIDECSTSSLAHKIC